LNLSKKILSLIGQVIHFSLDICVGCALDGAAVMMGCPNGVQAKLKDAVPHCHSHNPSLVVMGKYLVLQI